MLSRSVPDDSPSPFFAMHSDDESSSVRSKPSSSSTKAFVIGVAGGTASGKTSVCKAILDQLSGNGRVVILAQDSYYRGLTESELKHVEQYNFDCPGAFDWELIKQHLSLLKCKKPIDLPHYDFVTHQRTTQTTHIYGADVVLFEGILAFSDPDVRSMMDMMLFVGQSHLGLFSAETDADTRLIRRIRRDIKDRGRSLEGVLIQYETFVKPSFDQFIAPTKQYADVIIPRGQSNVVAIGLIMQHIISQLPEAHRTRTPLKQSQSGRKSKQEASEAKKD